MRLVVPCSASSFSICELSSRTRTTPPTNGPDLVLGDQASLTLVGESTLGFGQSASAITHRRQHRCIIFEMDANVLGVCAGLAIAAAAGVYVFHASGWQRSRRHTPDIAADPEPLETAQGDNAWYINNHGQFTICDVIAVNQEVRPPAYIVKTRDGRIHHLVLMLQRAANKENRGAQQGTYKDKI
jgi:hypothetical protein